MVGALSATSLIACHKPNKTAEATPHLSALHFGLSHSLKKSMKFYLFIVALLWFYFDPIAPTCVGQSEKTHELTVDSNKLAEDSKKAKLDFLNKLNDSLNSPRDKTEEDAVAGLLDDPAPEVRDLSARMVSAWAHDCSIDRASALHYFNKLSGLIDDKALNRLKDGGYEKSNAPIVGSLTAGVCAMDELSLNYPCVSITEYQDKLQSDWINSLILKLSIRREELAELNEGDLQVLVIRATNPYTLGIWLPHFVDSMTRVNSLKMADSLEILWRSNKMLAKLKGGPMNDVLVAELLPKIPTFSENLKKWKPGGHHEELAKSQALIILDEVRNTKNKFDCGFKRPPQSVGSAIGQRLQDASGKCVSPRTATFQLDSIPPREAPAMAG